MQLKIGEILFLYDKTRNMQQYGKLSQNERDTIADAKKEADVFVDGLI